MVDQVGVGPLVSLVRELGPAAAAVVVTVAFLSYLRWYVLQQATLMDMVRQTCATLITQQEAARAAFVAEMRSLLTELKKGDR